VQCHKLLTLINKTQHFPLSLSTHSNISTQIYRFDILISVFVRKYITTSLIIEEFRENQNYLVKISYCNPKAIGKNIITCWFGIYCTNVTILYHGHPYKVLKISADPH